MRGGGGKLDLDAYNDFELCLAIARSSVPVDCTCAPTTVVADLVHTAWKTLTEVAGVVQRFEDASLEVDALRAQLEYLRRPGFSIATAN